MQIKKIFSITSVLILAIFVCAVYWFIVMEQQPSEAQAPLPAVTVTTVQKHVLQNTIEAIGTANAEESVTITANVTEYVRQLLFEDGQFVQKGKKLVQLEDEEEQALLAEVQARLLVAQQFYNRTQKLSKQDYLSAQEHDSRIADLKAAEALTRALKARIQDRNIYAPFSGVLGIAAVSEGALIEPGTAIVNLDKIDVIDVDFNVPEKLFSQVKKGQTVALRSVALPDKVFQGTVSVINSRVDQNTRSFTVRVKVNNQNNELRPGMLMQVNIKEPPINVIVIPEAAVIANGTRHYVFLLEDNQNVKKQLIQLGTRIKGKVVVTEGLSAGETIIVEGGFKLKNGDKVKVIKDKKHVHF